MIKMLEFKSTVLRTSLAPVGFLISWIIAFLPLIVLISLLPNSDLYVLSESLISVIPFSNDVAIAANALYALYNPINGILNSYFLFSNSNVIIE